uniref:Odorant-binding protein 8 n=1 Tax=Yemma signatus TaxID=300820 RepID=A0A3G2GRS1_9HEMI|nr:odorant-binding protein 8 [Yemma signatus]
MRHVWILVFASAALFVPARAAMTEAQMRGAMKQVRKMCLPKSGASKEALAKMNDGDFDDDDRKLKCYLGCVMGMMQAVKGNKINLQMVRSQITKMLQPDFGQKILTTFEACQDVEGADSCEVAYQFAKCIYMKDKDAFIVP